MSCALTGPMFFSGTATPFSVPMSSFSPWSLFGRRLRETELERQVFLRVAVVVDVDLVQRGRIEREIVRAAVRILQRHVVGDERDVAGAAASYELNM